MWTDSSIALQWITGDGKHVKQNISSKVSEINKLTNVYDWRHCDGKCNPADLLTRGIKAKQLMQSELWKWGPSWLIMESNEWNISKIEDSATLITKVLQEENLHKGIQQSINTELEKIDDLTLEELNKAEVYWIGCAQSEYFLSEIISLKKGQKIGAESKILQLNPVLIDGLLRLSCRLPTTEYENLSNPIILPKESYLSKLIVLEAHQKFMHSGINATLAKIRKRFWVVKGRQLIKSVVQRCIICKRLHGKNASENWTDLPIERVTVSKPFETTGIDFAGPLYITSTDNKNDFKKAYIMLFTCAATRGIHLELAADLTVESCINALRKFIARRGTPSIIISDNAKIFKRSCMEVQKLEQLMEKTRINQFAVANGIKWKFIPKRAAWWGGFWERLVRTVKNCLKAAIGKARLTFYEMDTLLTEVESVVNQRPLTYITTDCNDLAPLTPAHFLGECGVLNKENFLSDGSTIAKMWQSRTYILKRYLKRWQDEYLTQLRSIHLNKSKPTKSINIGDVVLVKDEHQSRLLWRMAVVVATYIGRDGRARACDVRLKDQKIMRRPIQLLYPLELICDSPGPRM
ncbi:uncharacterized protein LOC119665767 [Teleopsis dalmanni]|uniref:uncharacterized protein LOC119665767 n=1 Tax=Teleopsis dalmanni TaxID=139649 RepID=UPI0018CF5CD8|nr:uncharacterized protein LOC119665767 [Teleopsis dalmanni]